MFYIFIVLYGLSLTEAYNIKLAGQVELGTHLSKIFRDAWFGGDNIDHDDGNTNRDGDNADKKIFFKFTPESAKSSITDKRPMKQKDEKGVPKGSDVESLHVSVLDEMVQNEQKKLHLYGNHKLDGGKGDGPLNNIHL